MKLTKDKCTYYKKIEQAVLAKQDAFDKANFKNLQDGLLKFMQSLPDQEGWAEDLASVQQAVTSRDLTSALFKVVVYYLDEAEGSFTADIEDSEENHWYFKMKILEFEEAYDTYIGQYI